MSSMKIHKQSYLFHQKKKKKELFMRKDTLNEVININICHGNM